VSTQLGQFVFAQPWYFLLVLLFVFLVIWQKRSGKSAALAVTSTASFAKTQSFLQRFLAKLPALLNTLGILLVITALAQPQIKNVVVHTTGDGVDIILCMDVSGSMLSKDYSPNRLEVAKEVAQKFALGRPYDNIGLVIFSGRSLSLCPLTTDHTKLNSAISTLRENLVGQGTAIGMGLATSVDRLQASKAKSRVVVLMTDGEDNCLDCPVTPSTATDLAQATGVKVYTIGVGTRGTAMQPVEVDVFGNYIFEERPVEIDEATLTEMAQRTGGTYHRCESGKELNQVFAEINKLEKSDIKVQKRDKIVELYTVPLLVGFVLLLISFILSRSIFKRFP
jgi:Ca-activated chloride channel family protein